MDSATSKELAVYCIILLSFILTVCTLLCLITLIMGYACYVKYGYEEACNEISGTSLEEHDSQLQSNIDQRVNEIGSSSNATTVWVRKTYQLST